MYRLAATIAVALIGFGTAGYLYFADQKYVLRIPESQIQQKIGEKLPLTKTYLFLFKVTLSNPKVDLVKDSGRILAGLDVLVKIKLEGVDDIKGSVVASGIPYYVPDKGQFFLSSPVVEKMDLTGVPEQYLDPAKQLIEDALTSYLKKHPVYKLKSDDNRHIAAKMVMKGISVEEKALVVTFGL